MLNQKILNKLHCLRCRGKLLAQESHLRCQHCGFAYPVENGIPFLIQQQGESFTSGNIDVMINRLKVLFKKYPWFFNLLLYAFGPSYVGKSAKNAIKDLGAEKLILNVGSGIKIIRQDVVNVDFYPFANVHLVADASRLPFKDNSVDAIICESTLEHVPNPWLVMVEFRRVLKTGGLLYLTMPFVAPFHSSPHDYSRLSRQGLRALAQGFQEQESGVRHGPTSVLVLVTIDWLATVFSLGWPPLQQILLMFFTVMTAPLKILDFLFSKFKTSDNIAYGFYYLGRKI